MVENTARLQSDFQEWETPPELFNYLDQQFDFTLDAAATDRTAKCDKYFTPEEDGLKQSWEDERVFLNPPFSDLAEWLEKVWEERERAEVIAVIMGPSTDTRYWHDYVMKADELWMFKSRPNYIRHGEEGNSGSTFPTVLAVFTGENEEVPEIKQVLDWKNQDVVSFGGN